MSRVPITDWKEWSDVFASATVIPGDKLSDFSRRKRADRTSHTWDIPRERLVPRHDDAPMYLDRFCTLKRLGSRIWLDVVPTKQAIEALTPHVTFVDGDVMNFEVIEWTNGQSLVVCRNNRIIAGPWLAKIDSVTIPNFQEE